ncbi:MAG: hypothetical protein IJV96_06045 [Clostridia bacterium]|nr:hypothetical protein [Clostridia bacterium]
MAKNQKNAKNEKNSRTSGGVCKMPAGTPSTNAKNGKADSPAANTPTPSDRTAAPENLGDDAPDGSGGRVQNPPVPNRARTEM